MRMHERAGIFEWVLVIVCGVCGACAGPPSPAVPKASVALRLTTAEHARRYAHHSQHLDRPFLLDEGGLSGTGLLLAFLQDAERGGAIYVSDVSYSLQLMRNGVGVECVSKIRVDDGRGGGSDAVPTEPGGASDDAAEGEVEYTTTVRPWRPSATDAWVVDREMVCAEHASLVRANTPRYDNRYNPEVRRYIAPGRMPVEKTEIEHDSRCNYAPHRQHVHRYEHFVAARFTPPDLAVIQRSFADAPLVEEPPVCHVIERAPGQPLLQHIMADVHFPSRLIVPLKENEIRIPQLGQ